MAFRALSTPMAESDRRSEVMAAVRTWAEGVCARVIAISSAMAQRKKVLLLAGMLMALVLFAELPWYAAVASVLILAAVIAEGGNEGEDNDASTSTESDDVDHPSPRAVGPRERTDGWRALVDAMPDPALVLDAGGNILHHNTLLLELFPMARVGQALSYMSRNPELNQAVEKAYTAADPLVVQLFERIPVERRVSATISRLSLSRERRDIPRLLVTFRDLTEQDRLAQMRADFIANASHELRTPLASLRGFVETLQGPARDDPAARDRFLSIMASQAMRMTRLIDDLLSLSRVEMRVHLAPRGIVDLNDVITYVAQALEPLAEGSRARIEAKKLDKPARIRGDRDEIVQVLQNLVHNALKYGRENGRVEIAVSRVIDGTPPAHRILLAVADDGPGIAPEHLPRLTERFYRANVAASREKGGTGLGLAIVKHIVIRHRGELRIASEVGKGSTFSVLFEELA